MLLCATLLAAALVMYWLFGAGSAEAGAGVGAGGEEEQQASQSRLHKLKNVGRAAAAVTSRRVNRPLRPG